jgi:hypothetical protein
MRSGASFAIMLTMLLSVAPVCAQQRGEETDRETQRRFDEGRKLLAAKRYEEAMQVFQRINADHPSVGALFNIAETQERLAHPVGAWASYREAEQLARSKNDPRADTAAARAGVVEAYLPRIVVTDPPSDLVVTMKDPIPRSEWNGPLRRGPGEYDLTARASCKTTYTAHIVIRDEARQADVVLPALGDDPKCAPPPPPPPHNTQRTIGYATGGAGIAVVAAGFVFGALALGTKSDLDDACGGSYRGCQTSNRAHTDALNSTARSQGTWSTIGITAGLALLAGGVVLILTSPKSAAPEHQGQP